MPVAPDEKDIRDQVKERYGQAARRIQAGAEPGCSAGGGGCSGAADPITANLYPPGQAAALPESALLASLGCGNPTALAALRPGEIVLDLGSGGGLDVLLSARRVAPTGKAYGLDMTDAMLAVARAHQRQAGIVNAEFLLGEIENIPLPDDTVDVIISNCVVNLSADKDRVLREAWRVLKPGGRLAIADIVVRGDAPAALRQSLSLWAGCIAGALSDAEYEAKLRAAGFVEISIEPTRVYSLADARDLLHNEGMDAPELASQIEGRLMSAFVRGAKKKILCGQETEARGQRAVGRGQKTEGRRQRAEGRRQRAEGSAGVSALSSDYPLPSTLYPLRFRTEGAADISALCLAALCQLPSAL